METIKVDNIGRVETNKICYYKQDGIWWIYFSGCGTGNLSNHKIIENEDGTITVTPSILVKGHRDKIVHGYLTNGVWKDC